MIFIITHVILSHPKLWFFVQSSEQTSSINSLTISFRGISVESLSSTKSTTSCELLTSQIPSHAMTIKSSSSSIGRDFTSGTQVIGCFSTGSFFCLWLKSPIDRDKFKFPSTLPSITLLPEFIIRSYSNGFSGL